MSIVLSKEVETNLEELKVLSDKYFEMVLQNFDEVKIGNVTKDHFEKFYQLWRLEVSMGKDDILVYLRESLRYWEY